MSEIADEQKARFARAAQEFRMLLHLGPDERRTQLAAIELRDPALAQEVRSLLQHESAGASFLSQPVVMAPEGMLVGRYLIVGRIGEGGMGTVFLAEQVEPVRRQVALKLIKLGMDSRAIVRRFEAERQVLARMEHPGIARILDGGVAADGRPYFVMELVRGVPITQWCDTHHLDASARIALFLDVCSAVQHAHQKGVIHRDLKPSNLMVTEVDGRAMPKVIDFGIARALDDDGAAESTHTAAARLAGTPEYMSPEQSNLTGQGGFDIRSDVYSLGVVLYELLTGTTPARARTRSGNVRRPGSIRPRLRGNLDAIILKAVAPEPQRRYATVAALAEDLERHLRHEPVLARPAGALYLGTQFARRHTLALSAATAVLLALVAGLGFALWGLQQAREELFVSSIGGGRLAGVAGDLVVARDTLWRCHLEQPNSPRAAWALRELYFRNPCIWTARRPGLRSAQLRALDEGTVVMTSAGGAPFKVDVETGEERLHCEKPKDDGAIHAAYRMDNAPDGSLVAVGDGRGDVRLWSLNDGRFLRTVASHGEGPAAVRFMADSATVLTGGSDGRILLTHVDHPEAPALLYRADVSVRSLAVHRPSGQLAAGLADGSILLWKDLNSTPSRLKQHSNLVMCMEFDEPGERLASGSTDRSTVIWSLADGADPLKLVSNNGTVRDLAFASDGSLYILNWWHVDRLRPGASQIELVIAEGGARLTIPRTGEIMISSSQEHAVRRWRTDASTLFEPVPADAGWTVRCVAGGDAPLLLAKGRSLMARSFDGATRWKQQFPANVSAVAASRNGECVAVGTVDRAVWVRRSAGSPWKQVALGFLPGTGDVMAVDAAGSRVAYAAAGNAVTMIELDEASSSTRQAFPESENEQLTVHFSHDGKMLLATERRGLLRVFDLHSGERWAHKCGPTIFAVDTLLDGTALLGSWTGPLLTADARNGVQSTLRGHTAIAGAVAAHPTDPQLVLTGSMDGTVRLWHLGLKCELQSLSPLGGLPIGFVAFDASGTRVVAAGSNGRAVTWPLYLADRYIKGNYPGSQAADPDQLRQPERAD